MRDGKHITTCEITEIDQQKLISLISPKVNKLKIGYFSSFFEGNRAGIENDRAVLELLKNQGITLHPVELKTSINAAPLVSMLLVAGAAAFDDLTRLGLDDQLVAQHKSAWPNVFRAARFIPAVEYIQMSRQRSVLIEEMHALMKEYDVIINQPQYDTVTVDDASMFQMMFGKESQLRKDYMFA